MPRLADQGKRLLDIGCGDCSLVNCLYHLTDFELRACNFAEKLTPGVNPRISTFVYDGRQLTEGCTRRER